MVSVSHLKKRYGSHLAVDDLSFEVGKGEVVGFLGPNGAGKSTTLRILSGFLGMTSGRVKVAGFDIEEDSFEARQQVGYMPEAVPLYPEMRVAEYLAFRAELKRVPRAQRRASVDLAMEKASVTDRANVLIGNLSKGYKQRVGLADALVARPPLLILDEPTAGLDPNQIREVREVIKALGTEHTVLLSTHILSEVEASCSKVIVIARGRLVAEGPTADIRRMRRASALDVTARGEEAAVLDVLRATPGTRKATRLERDAAARAESADVATYRCTWSKKLDGAEVARHTEDLVARMIAAGLHVREVRPAGSSLEDVFTALTGDERARGAAEGAGDDDTVTPAEPTPRDDGGARP
jgi:ABC-2 type transport system ATP-binding protein